MALVSSGSPVEIYYTVTRGKKQLCASCHFITSDTRLCRVSRCNFQTLQFAATGDQTMPDDLWRWSACNLAKAVREKTVSSREVVEAHLDRIATVNSAVNAITVVFADEALAAADAANYRDAIAERHRMPVPGIT